MDSETMTTKEVLKTLGIGRTTLHNRVKAGLITPLPKNVAQGKSGHPRYSREQIMRLAQPLTDEPKT